METASEWKLADFGLLFANDWRNGFRKSGNPVSVIDWLID